MSVQNIPSEKILSSPFTGQWVVDKINKCLGTTAQLETWQARDITGGIGFLSDVIKLEFNWKSPVPGQMPKSVVLKVPGIEHAMENFANLEAAKGETQQPATETSIGTENLSSLLTSGHRNELEVYQHFKHNPPLPMPKFYYGEEWAPMEGKDGIIIMEDFSDVAAVVNVADGLSLEQAYSLIEALTSLHAQTLNSEEEKWMQKLIRPFYAGAENTFKSVGEQFVKMKPYWFEKAFKKIEHLYTLQALLEALDCHKTLGLRPVLAHGDLWTSNILFRKRPDGTTGAEIAAIIDWQLPAAGCIMTDFIHVLSVSMPSDLRRREKSNFLKFYHEKLTEKVGGSEPFSLEMVHKAYAACLPFGLIHTFFALPLWLKMKAVVGDEADEKHEQRVSQLMLRAKGLTDELLEQLETEENNSSYK